MAWPIYNSRDLSRLQNWRQWLGFFARPQASQDFVSVVDLAHQEGIVRIFPHTMAHGSKGFAMGWRNPIGAAQWTDDDSYYAELHGGLAPTFWDSASIGAHQTIEWEETWYPLAGLNDVTSANREAALHIEHTGSTLSVGLFSTRARIKPHLTVWQRSTCQSVADFEISAIDPATPQVVNVSTVVPLNDLAILFHDDYALFIGYNEKDCVPPSAHVDGLPHVTTSSAFTVTWTGSDLYSGIAAYDVQFKDGHSGVWTNWLTDTTATSASFGGEHGHTYFFRVRARDAQGNIGTFRDDSEGDTFTTVLLTPAPVLEFSYKSVPTFFNAGQQINYAIVLKNTGNLTGLITLTDTLPLSLTLISGTLTAESGIVAYEDSHILWSGTITPEWGVGIQYALTPAIALGLLQPQTNTVVITGGVVPITRTATTMLALNIYLPIVSR